MRSFLFLSFFTLSFSFATWAQEVSEAFLIDVFDKSIKVVAPQGKSKKIAVIIKNQTLSALRAKLISDDGLYLKMMNLAPRKELSLEIEIKDKERYFFVPLAPPIQEVELQWGKKTYEVPSLPSP